MKIKKSFWVIFGYFGIIFLFFLALDPILNFIDKSQNADSGLLFRLFYYPLESIGYIPWIIYGFTVIITFFSFFFYLKYRRQNKLELMKGFKITSIISIIGLVYLITGILIN